jgi:putative FmdB family regulatory protein
MPIYEYVCDECGTRYEQIVMSKNTKIACPKCASGKRTMQLSVFSSVGSDSKANGSSASSGACGCTPKTCGCH